MQLLYLPVEGPYPLFNGPQRPRMRHGSPLRLKGLFPVIYVAGNRDQNKPCPSSAPRCRTVPAVTPSHPLPRIGTAPAGDRRKKTVSQDLLTRVFAVLSDDEQTRLQPR